MSKRPLAIFLGLCVALYVGSRVYEIRTSRGLIYSVISLRTARKPRQSQYRNETDYAKDGGSATSVKVNEVQSQFHASSDPLKVVQSTAQLQAAQVRELAVNKKEEDTLVKSSAQHYLPRKPDTLTRIASEFVDDKLLSTCPSHSVMIDRTLRELEPLHDDCPDLFIIGVRKGGTTAMLQYLSKHPDFKGALLNKTSQKGETFYFSDRYKIKTWEWYSSLFPSNTKSGESSVNYFGNCQVPKLIWKNCGNHSKIVVLLRNPKDRYQSHFLMRVHGPSYRTFNSDTKIKQFVKSGYLSFTSKVLRVTKVPRINSLKWLQTNWSKLVCLYRAGFSMLFEGYYYVHLMNWLCNFPSENILILNSEEYYRDTAYVVSQVMEFLELSPLPEEFLRNTTSKTYNAGHHEDQLADHRLDTEDNKMLASFYHYSNVALFHMLKWNTTGW